MTNFVQKSIVKTADLVIFCNLWRLRNNQVLWTNQKSFTEKWHNVMTCLVMVFSYVANYSRNVFKSALNQSTLILIIFILEVHFDQKCFHIAICRFFLVSGFAKTYSFLVAVMAHSCPPMAHLCNFHWVQAKWWNISGPLLHLWGNHKIKHFACEREIFWAKNPSYKTNLEPSNLSHKFRITTYTKLFESSNCSQDVPNLGIKHFSSYWRIIWKMFYTWILSILQEIECLKNVLYVNIRIFEWNGLARKTFYIVFRYLAQRNRSHNQNVLFYSPSVY